MSGDATRSEIVVPAGAGAVWAALTEREELRAWFGGELELDARPGGDVRASWPDGARSVGSVEVVEPGIRLALRWRRIDGVGFGSRVGEATRVEFVLEPVPGGTRVRVTEERVELASVGERPA